MEYEQQGGEMGKSGHEMIPSARRLMTSMRDMGYDFATAVADVVDNSVEARATHVAIDVRFDGDGSWVRIIDNGTGMKPAQIREALRYGSEREYDGHESLGKFGLGLKTASLSQCRVLTVASRTQKSGRMEVRQLDLDHIEDTNDWEILQLSAAERPEPVEVLGGRGTVVLLDFDQVLLGRR
jgi:DNA topoisomerase VI subunit B